MRFRELLALAAIAIASAFAGAAVHARQSNTNSQQQSSTQSAASTQSKANSQSKTNSSDSMGEMPGMPGMEGMPGMDHNSATQAEAGADHEMMRGHHMHMGSHMHMTSLRPANAADWARADQIAAELRDAIEPYKDYRVALADGYRPFLPNVAQDIYHFTNYMNGFLESFTFDATRPTSLLYKKTPSGYELVGAMYTMPRSATEDQLNARIPLSVAQWHQHTNLCLPPRGMPRVDIMNSKEFGLTGSISTKEGCEAAGGRFLPVVFGWMVHVYPYEATREKIWEQ
jgi:hypothetical protein